eukprot:14091-Heterococcus_DN1.PRE.2
MAQHSNSNAQLFTICYITYICTMYTYCKVAPASWQYRALPSSKLYRSSRGITPLHWAKRSAGHRTQSLQLHGRGALGAVLGVGPDGLYSIQRPLASSHSLPSIAAEIASPKMMKHNPVEE